MMHSITPTKEYVEQVQITDEQMAVKLLEQAQYNINSNFLKIAQYLYTISERELFREWGYESIWKFLEENEKLDIERRTAEMLMRIWRNFGPESLLPIPLKTLAEIGYTKAYFLTMLRTEGLLTQSNLNEWIEKALSMTTRKFKEEIDKALGKENTKHDWVSFTFRVPPQDYEKINDAIVAIAKLENIPQEEIRKKRGELLSRIIQDWIDYYAPVIYEDLNDEEAVAFRLKKIKEQLEGMYGEYGVKVILPGEPEEDINF